MSDIPVTVLYPPDMALLADELAPELGVDARVLCTSEIAELGPAPAACWETFPSGDPDIKLRIDAVRGRHVIFLMSSDKEMIFEQLSVLLFLQRFHVPLPLEEYAKDKWKRSLADSKYEIASAAFITVVIPWYRHCQMERTSRWAIADGKWVNSKPEGNFVDVPTALQYAALLSAPPIVAGPRGGGPWPKPPLPPPPKKRLMLLDIHEYEDLELALNASGAWANPQVPYDYVHGTGTYFASAFDYFLQYILQAKFTGDKSGCFVVFPDAGAHRRFHRMVMRACQIGQTQILWIPKSRIGADIKQTNGLMYLDEAGAERLRADPIPGSSYVLLADDFTNSGSTLFGGAKVIRKHAEPSVHVAAYVSHFVGKYDRPTVSKFVSSLYDNTGERSLDEFYCTDSVAQTIAWLREDLAKRPQDEEPRCHIMSLARVIKDWVITHQPKAPECCAS
mmetsp:Transcript_27495/g.83656  ORF Transcript_27495/g.83656 Transcript_27495/m.83656 type:complete len:449 (+) Transcript_27495:107-1453(+)